MTELTFNVLISQLTKDHPVMVERDEGQEVHMVPALLVQLRDAVFGGKEQGGGSAFGAKLPIDASAVDLLDEITTQATVALAAVSLTPTPYGQAEHYVALWAGQTAETSMFVLPVKATNPEFNPPVYRELREYSAVELAATWVRRIEDFFNPPKSRAIPNPCPMDECGARYSHRMVDGEMKRSAALRISTDRVTGRAIEAKCSECGTTWEPSQLIHLAAILGYEPLSDTPGMTML